MLYPWAKGDWGQGRKMIVADWYRSLRSYVRNRWKNKTHQLTSRLEKGQYHELDDRMLHCLCDELVNFVDNEASKEKATFNLSKQILQNLEEKWVRLRRELGSKKISKTMIVEAALGIVLREYENRKQESQLYSVIADHKEINTGYNK